MPHWFAIDLRGSNNNSDFFFFFKLIFLGVLRLARIDLGAVIVRKVNAGVVSAPALLQTGNVIRMFVGIAGSGELITDYFFFGGNPFVSLSNGFGLLCMILSMCFRQLVPYCDWIYLLLNVWCWEHSTLPFFNYYA